LQAVPVIAYLHHGSAFSWPGQRVDVSSAKRMVLLEDVEAALAARPPVAQQGAAEALLLDALFDAEWRDKLVTPVGEERYQNWRISLFLPVPESATDKSPKAALARALATTRPYIAQAERALVQMVLDDMDTCCGELGAGYEFSELSAETVNALRLYRTTARAPVAAPQPVAQGLTDEQVAETRRDKFEAVARDFAMSVVRDGDRYSDPTTDWAWTFWKAALSTTYPAQADEGDTKASADEGGV
jgi:hypothetical protein